MGMEGKKNERNVHSSFVRLRHPFPAHLPYSLPSLPLPLLPIGHSSDSPPLFSLGLSVSLSHSASLTMHPCAALLCSVLLFLLSTWMRACVRACVRVVLACPPTACTVRIVTQKAAQRIHTYIPTQHLPACLPVCIATQHKAAQRPRACACVRGRGGSKDAGRRVLRRPPSSSPFPLSFFVSLCVLHLIYSCVRACLCRYVCMCAYAG